MLHEGELKLNLHISNSRSVVKKKIQKNSNNYVCYPKRIKIKLHKMHN